MRVIADLIAAGVDKELVAQVADEIANARAEGAASVAGMSRSARQERNNRYYEAHKDELRLKRLKASETSDLRRFKTDGGSPPEVPPKNNIKPPPTPHSPVSKRERATRLPSDWQPSEDHFGFAAERYGMTRAEVTETADEFRDFWAGVPGTRGTKLDWHGTFRNRLREVAGRKAARHRPPSRAGPNGRSELGLLTRLASQRHDHEPDFPDELPPDLDGFPRH